MKSNNDSVTIEISHGGHAHDGRIADRLREIAASSLQIAGEEILFFDELPKSEMEHRMDRVLEEVESKHKPKFTPPRNREERKRLAKQVRTNLKKQGRKDIPSVKELVKQMDMLGLVKNP